MTTTGFNFQVASLATGTVNRVRQTPILGAIGELANAKAQPCWELVQIENVNKGRETTPIIQVFPK